MIEFLEGSLVIASVIGVLYAPFHFLDKFASPEAKARALNAIRTGQSITDTKPLVSLMETFFGPKHFTFRCFILSSITSLVFTFLFLGVANEYLLDFATYLEDYKERTAELEEKLEEAVDAIIPAYDILIEALEEVKSEDSRLEELKERRQDLERMRNTPRMYGTPLLLWMVLSVAISMNLLCDYLSLGESRVILKRISRTDSAFKIVVFLVVDLLLSVLIWIVSVSVFIIINVETFLAWGEETPVLVAAVGIVSLVTTLSTSIWIYTFLIGSLLSAQLRKIISSVLRSTTILLDPEEHTFKIIGIIGSVAVFCLLMIALLVA